MTQYDNSSLPVRQFKYPMHPSLFTGGTPMTQPTSAVSLRITEDDLALLDARIGTDGARNRSDVVRLAIQEFLHNQPLLQDMKSVRIPLGRYDQLQLGKLYELQGVTPEIAAQEGLKLYMRKAAAEMEAVSSTFDSVLEASRTGTIRRSEYQQ
jgi:Arc/MetJ-type ribon-helix-helix transcriptional regulator